MDTALTIAIGSFGALIGAVTTGIGFLLKRWITGAKHDEMLGRGIKVAELLKTMKESGLSEDDFKKWGLTVQGPERLPTSSADEGPQEPQAFHSNLAMKMRAGARYRVAEALMNQALVDLRLLLRSDEVDSLEAGQKHWEGYRAALAEIARKEYEGGTHAPLAAAWALLHETERRTAELRLKIDEIISRSA